VNTYIVRSSLSYGKA